MRLFQRVGPGGPGRPGTSVVLGSSVSRVSAGLPSGVWTRVGVGLLAAVIALGAGMIGAAPARAADLGTVTVTGGPDPYASSPGSLTGAVGDTFRVVNATAGGDTVNVGTTDGVDTGSVSVGAQACGAPGSQATCIASVAGTTYTITRLGTISITYTSGGSQAPIGPILLQAAGGGSADPKVVYPFLTLNPNGGTCSGTLEFNAIPGTSNDSVTLPTSSTCTRSGYELSGWAYNADGTGTVLTPGIEVATGSTTLYAVWRPNGVQVTYDANVGMSKECFAVGANAMTADDRRATSVVQLGSSSATTAPCTPVDSRLAGWAYTGNGSVAFTAGQSLPATFRSGSSVTLFAKWETVYGLSASASSVKFSPGGSAVVTFTATVNGAPAPGSAVELRTSGDPVSLSPGPSVAATTDNAGKVSVTITKPSAGEATVTAAFGDKTATVNVSVEATPQTKSITIVGSRTTVAGKPGIEIDGITVGIEDGKTVIPYFRFPGETSYTEGSARPVITDDEFTWQRKTGKKFYAYVTNDDGSVTSNRVIIPAN